MSILDKIHRAFSSYPMKGHSPDDAKIKFNIRILNNIGESRDNIFSPISEECRQKYLSALEGIINKGLG